MGGEERKGKGRGQNEFRRRGGSSLSRKLRDTTETNEVEHICPFLMDDLNFHGTIYLQEAAGTAHMQPTKCEAWINTHLEGLELFLDSSAPPPPASICNVGVYNVVQTLSAQMRRPKFRCWR